MAAHDDTGEYDNSFNSFSFNGSSGDEGERPEETIFGMQPVVHEAVQWPQPQLHMLGDELLQQDTVSAKVRVDAYVSSAELQYSPREKEGRRLRWKSSW